LRADQSQTITIVFNKTLYI